MTGLTWLDPLRLEFPPSSQALDEPNGLLAAGGDLSPERLVLAYRSGIFPWYETGQPVLWWCPDPRSLLLLDKLHISRSLARELRKKPFRITADTVFADVMSGCAAPRSAGGGTWITAEMLQAYDNLHQQGLAHSIEAWDDQGELVGGLYGVAIGGAFFGESMFSVKPNASKIALVALVARLREWSYEFVDCQVENTHLVSLGAQSVPRLQFETMLANAIDREQQRQLWTDAFSGVDL